MNVETQQERRSILDDFVASSTDQSVATVPVVAMPSSPERVFGAQKVAVYRDEGRVLKRLRELAAAAGESWFYRFPVKNRKENRVDHIEGPSIKLANELCRIYGNCEVDCRAQDIGDYWLFHARFIDLETGYSLTRPFQQRKSAGKIGGADEERRLDIAFQIGASKAIRNCVVNALETFADFAFSEAKNALVERIGKNLDKYRSQTAERVSARLDIKRVEAVVGRPAKEWLAPDIARVIAMMKAVTDGMSSLDETFPPLETTERKAADLDAFANSPSRKGGDEDGGSRSPDQPSKGAADDDNAAATGSSSADPNLRQECIDKLLKLATDETLNVEQRLETLQGVEQDWLDQLPGDQDFVRKCTETMEKVITGETKADQAKRYLSGLKNK